MTTSAAHRIAAGAPPADPPPFPDELLEDIFLRLDDAADLARASAACKSFRRVASARRFLRRYRSLHAPPLLGLVDLDGFHPAEPPHRWSPAARAFERDVDPTFSFLPEPGGWIVRDARDGLVLFQRRDEEEDDDALDDLVVCDPLYRRYVQLPPIPDDLVASFLLPGFGWPRRREFTAFLAPTSEDDEEGSPFSVICTKMKSDTDAVALVFSLDNGEWRGTTYHSSRSLPHGLFGYDDQYRRGYDHGYQRSYAHGCFFWTDDYWMRFSLVLDIHEMKFSIIDLPRKPKGCAAHAIVDAGEGMLGLVTFDDTTVYLFRRVWRNNGGLGGEQWQPHKTTTFPKDSDGEDCDWYIVGTGVADGYLLMIRFDSMSSSSDCPWLQYYTLDPKTLVLERLLGSDCAVCSAHLYARFPPLLSPPTI